MHLCPECLKPCPDFIKSGCQNCKSYPEFVETIPILLSSKDKRKTIFQNYKENYDQIAFDDLEHSIQPPDFLDAQCEKIFSYIPKIKNLSICEIGVGQGRLINKLTTLSPTNLIGVDIAPAYLSKLMKEKVPFKPMVLNAENFPFQEEFDLVVSTDVLEHVLNVGDYLHGIHRSLKKNGTFIVHVPYLEDYSVYAKAKGCKYDFVHLRSFSRHTLKVLLEGSGFKVRKFKFDGYLAYRLRFCNNFRLKDSNSIFARPGKFIARHILPKFYKMKNLSRIPNWLGFLLMKPIGIAAICTKR